MNTPPIPVPRATYRVQLNKDFTFAQLEAIAPYLGALGISHAYLSPILKARPGSTHGYDLVDPSQVNPELGSLDDFRRMAGTLRRHGIGIVLDIVPNHMGIGGDENPLWLDVLEWGRHSRYAGWFDINWSPAEPTLRDKVLVPFLGDSYGNALANGKLELRFDAAAGSFAVWAEDHHRLPVTPPSYARILAEGGADLAALAPAFAALADDDFIGAANLKRKLAALASSDLERLVARFNAAPRDALAALIAAQYWRPARYSVADADINYRRFFIVSDLAGIRIERDDVFDHVHALVFQLVGEGLIEGLRIDHIDGLYDPKAYLHRLRERCPRPVYLVVEKILAPHEQLRSDWGVEGTTGYEFGAAATQLLVDPAGEAPLTRTYRDFTGRTATLTEEENAAKVAIADVEMAAELESLAARLRALAVADRATADLSRHALRAGLREFVAALPVYRTYVDGGALADSDRRNIAYAIAKARAATPAADPAVLDFIAAIATGTLAGASADAVLDLACRLQQFTGPVMAKGLEDTALYRYNRLIALSEVGARPDRFSRSVAAFHDSNRARAAHFPHAMLGSSTHDTKRGEDTRARIAVLSGLPEDWAAAVASWRDGLAGQGAPAIDPNDLYHLYHLCQLVLGAWPAAWPEEGAIDPASLAGFRDRVQAAMLKSVREARRRTNWLVPNAAYEDAVTAVVAALLDPNGVIFASLRNFANRIGLFGAQHAIVQTALKLTLPGVPDIYQGAEHWDQSTVDPDNRRPVDFALRRTLLEAIDPDADLAALMPDWRDGRVKLGVVARLLALRRDYPELFAAGSYEPLHAGGPDAGRVVAFHRRHGGSTLAVIVVRHPWRGSPDATLTLGEGRWRDLLRRREVLAAPDTPAAGLFDDLPVAVLVRL